MQMEPLNSLVSKNQTRIPHFADAGNDYLVGVGFRTGNPGVFRSNPYPNPSLPVPGLWGMGLSVNGLRVRIVYINLVLHYII